MKRRLFLLSLLTFFILTLSAQVKFEVNVPQVVAVGEVFRMEFALNDKPSSFTPPSFDGVDVLAGPTESAGKSVQIMNGNMTQQITHTYTYILQCNSEGDFNVSSAEAVVDGKTYKTKPFSIKAVAEVGGDGDAQQGQAQQSNAQGGTRQKGNAVINPNDVFVRVIVDKSNVYKGQPVKATLKLYTKYNINVDNIKFPAFNGFWTQEINDNSYQWMRESYDNKIYSTRIIREYLLFPQQSGTLSIEQFELSAIIQIVTQQRSQSIFDDFFGGGQDVQEVPKKLQSAPVRITVKELPQGAPASFSGAVGEFDMTSQLPPTDMTVNSASNYQIKISGSGNLPLVQAPQLTLPTSFEQYNVKTTESWQSSAAGINGYRQFDYPMIARAEGDFTIPSVEFSYFNPRLMKYVTLATDNLNVVVQPDSTASSTASRGMVSGLSKEDLKFLGQDIRFIKLGQSNLQRRGSTFMASGLYFMILLLIVGGFVALYYWLRKLLRERRNIALLKGKRANKIALQRFREAERNMKQDNQRGFYEEMLRALWGYMGDKLNIPAANLTKESVREELQKRTIQPDQIERYISIISECEYAQYSPATTGRMNELYVDGVEIVSKLESVINR